MPYTRGEKRDELLVQVSDLYGRGYSIRAVAKELGYSYGAIHAMLKQTGVQLRDRGYQGRVQQAAVS